MYDAGNGPTIVFLHGNASRWQHWAPQLEALSSRFRCIAFDFRGYGASSTLMDSNSLSLMADDTAERLQALGVDHAYVVGASMGGEVAQAFAIRHPDRVAGLVLAGTGPLAAPPGEMPEITHELLRPMLLAGFGPTFKERHPDAVERLIDEYLATDLGMLTRVSFHDIAELDATRITAPALVIAGEHDALKPAGVVRQLAVSMPNATYLQLTGAGHYMNVEASEAFTAAVVDFIEKGSVGAA